MKTLKKVEIKPCLDTIPPKESMEFGKIYISESHGIAIHLCLCGCGQEVVTPFSQGWSVTVKDEKVSISPSVLNRWCNTHYIITNNIANFV